jgi:hypothetical protein
VSVNPFVVGHAFPVELARGQTDAAGRVDLRGRPSIEALAGFHDGLADLIVVASHDGLVSMPQQRTVSFDEVDADRPVWRHAAGEQASEVVTLVVDALTPGASMKVEPPTCVGGTTPIRWNRYALGDTQVGVGSTLLAPNTPLWQSEITYENTRSTELATGFSWTVGAGPLSFENNGSVRRDSSAGVAATGHYTGSGSATNRKQTITIQHFLDEYRCWTNPNSTPPANPGNWPVVGVATVPGTWVRDYFGSNLDNQGVPFCSSARTSTYGPGVFERTNGSSYTISGGVGVSVSFNGKSGLFAGDADVTTSRTAGARVTQRWINTATSVKHLCGVNTANIAGTGNVGPIVAKP